MPWHWMAGWRSREAHLAFGHSTGFWFNKRHSTSSHTIPTKNNENTFTTIIDYNQQNMFI
jgi:hypothetical protein